MDTTLYALSHFVSPWLQYLDRHSQSVRAWDTTLWIAGNGVGAPPPTKEDHYFDSKAFAPLLHFRYMRPGLVVNFSFVEVYGSPIMPATWKGVADFFTQCPMLHAVQIMFDATRNIEAVHGPDVRPATRLRSPGLPTSILNETEVLTPIAQVLVTVAHVP
ncbi:hypothetical protein C8Q77DRAFT_1162154 [Trametes polyzona]|nr:hypothetical protein C8Q77DRAFT_1162154 [Trametes polyzona]